MDITLAKGQTHDIQISAKFLNFVLVNGDVSASMLGHSITCRAGDSVNFDSADADVRSVQLRNNGDSDATVSYELSPVRVHGASGAAVSIDGTVTVDKIETGISVTADATVENGSVAVLPFNSLSSTDYRVIPSGMSQLSVYNVAVERQNARRRLLQMSVSGDGVILVAGRKMAADMFGGDTLELSYSGAVQAHGLSGDVYLNVIDLWSTSQ